MVSSKKQLTLEETLAVAKTLRKWTKSETKNKENLEVQSYTGNYKQAVFTLDYLCNPNENSNTYNISYSFDDRGLNEIQSDVYIKNPNNTEKVFNSFKSYFDDRFGKNETHQGFIVWTVKSEKYGDVRINLSDESSDFTIPGSPGKIALWIYPDKE